jgi:hypothetical protein
LKFHIALDEISRADNLSKLSAPNFIPFECIGCWLKSKRLAFFIRPNMAQGATPKLYILSPEFGCNVNPTHYLLSTAMTFIATKDQMLRFP